MSASPPLGPAGPVALEGAKAGPLHVDRLRRDLASMWKSASSQAGGTAVSRACSSTLVFLCPPGEVAAADAWIQEITRRHPCRVIRVESVTGAAEELNASAGAICHVRPLGGSLICIEEIRITAGGSGEDRVASAVRSLTVGGLPLVLLAPTPGARGSAAFASVAADADVTIVYSRSLDELDGAEALPRVRDLAWSRGALLRRAIGIFSGSPEARGMLHSLRRVRVDHVPSFAKATEGRAGNGKAVAASTLLLAGWIASRLGLEVGGTGSPLPLVASDRRVELTFRAIPGAVDGPVGLELAGESGEELAVSMSNDRARSRGPAGDAELMLRQPDRAGQVIDEIHRHQPDPEFREALGPARRVGRALPEE